MGGAGGPMTRTVCTLAYKRFLSDVNANVGIPPQHDRMSAGEVYAWGWTDAVLTMRAHAAQDARRGDEWRRGMYMHGITGAVPHLRNRRHAWACRGLEAPAGGHIDLSVLTGPTSGQRRTPSLLSEI